MDNAARLRIAHPDDAAAIAAIYTPFVRDTVISFETEPPDEAEMRRRITATLETHPWLVAEQSGEILGYADASQHRARLAYRWACDVAIYLDPQAKGRGLGTALYTELLHILTRQGFRHAFGGIALPNAASITLHENLGFKHLGTYTKVGFKLGQWHDVGWWQCQLRSGMDTPSEVVAFSQLAP